MFDIVEELIKVIDKQNDPLWDERKDKVEEKFINKYLDQCIGKEVEIEFRSGNSLVGFINQYIINKYEKDKYGRLIFNNEMIVFFDNIKIDDERSDMLKITKKDNDLSVCIFIKNDEFIDEPETKDKDFINEMIGYFSYYDCETCSMHPKTEYENCIYQSHCPFIKVVQILRNNNA